MFVCTPHVSAHRFPCCKLSLYDVCTKGDIGYHGFSFSSFYSCLLASEFLVISYFNLKRSPLVSVLLHTSSLYSFPSSFDCLPCPDFFSPVTFSFLVYLRPCSHVNRYFGKLSFFDACGFSSSRKQHLGSPKPDLYQNSFQNSI